MQWRRVLPSVVGIALGLLAAAAVLLVAGRRTLHRDEGRVGAPLLPEANGALREVVLHYVPKFDGLVDAPYSDFLRAIDPQVRVVFVVPEGLTAPERGKLDALLARIDPAGGLARRVSVVQSPGPITTWSKDRALVTRPPAPGQAALLLAPSEPSKQWAERHNDWLTVQSLARWSAGRFKAESAALDFDAGDFIIDHGTVIVDTNLLDKNRHRGIGDVIELRKRLVAWLQAPVIVLGKEPGDTPRHHLAMYMTPLQQKVAVVGDPRAACAIVGDPFEPGDLSGDTGEPLRADFSDEMTNRFELAAEQLASHGYRVVRIPNVPFDHKTYMAYSNGVFETRDGKQLAYMPVYGVEALDRRAREVYEQLGWEVHPVRVKTVYPYHGTIGCLVNVLARD
jgi:hypothetical protein